MDCGFDYCIYNRKYSCTLKKIEVDSNGMCASCTVISLDKNFLEAEKERQLRKIERM